MADSQGAVKDLKGLTGKKCKVFFAGCDRDDNLFVLGTSESGVMFEKRYSNKSTYQFVTWAEIRRIELTILDEEEKDEKPAKKDKEEKAEKPAKKEKAEKEEKKADKKKAKKDDEDEDDDDLDLDDDEEDEDEDE